MHTYTHILESHNLFRKMPSILNIFYACGWFSLCCSAHFISSFLYWYFFSIRQQNSKRVFISILHIFFSLSLCFWFQFYKKDENRQTSTKKSLGINVPWSSWLFHPKSEETCQINCRSKWFAPFWWLSNGWTHRSDSRRSFDPARTITCRIPNEKRIERRKKNEWNKCM